MPTATPPARYLSAKELSTEFRALNIRPSSYRAMLALIGECEESVGAQILLEDAKKFLRQNPTWAPNGKGRHAKAAERTGRQSPTIVTL